MWRRNIKVLGLFVILFIIFFLVIANALSIISDTVISKSFHEVDFQILNINCMEDKRHNIVLSEDFLSHYLESHGCLADYREDQARIHYKDGVIGNKLIPFNSYFRRDAYFGVIFPTGAFPSFKRELEFREKAYILMDEKFKEWRPESEELNWYNQDEFKRSPQYEEFLNEIFIMIEDVEGANIDELYHRAINIRAEKGMPIKRFYFNYYEIPLRSPLIASSYKMYPEFKKRGDWISAYCIARYLYGMNKLYEYNLNEDLSWGEYIYGSNYHPWTYLENPEYVMIDPYPAILLDIILSFLLSGAVTYIIFKKRIVD